MTLRARPFRDEDMAGLMDALAGWVESAGMCGYGHIGTLPHRAYQVLRGRPAGELAQVWADGAGLAGVSLCGLFGAAFDVLARPDLRGGPAELAMLEAAAATTRADMRARGEADVQVITDVYSCDEPRKALLGQMGFVQYRVWDDVRVRDLAAPIAEAAPPDGFLVRPATWGDAAGLAAAHGSAFGDSLTADEYREQVMRKPGYAPEREIIALAPDGQVAAFCLIWLDARNRAGLFEPVGTAAGFRRLGLARAAMGYGLAELRRRGMRTAIVAHDATNAPAQALYVGLGFRKIYATLGFREGGL